MTALSVIQAVARRISIPVPNGAVSSTDSGVLQLLDLLTEACADLLKAHDWSALTTPRTFTCGASNEQTSELQSDFDRLTRGVDMWNDTRNWPIKGPITAEEWLDLIVRSVQTVPQYWRRIGGQLNIFAPTSGDTIRYEYVSNKVVYVNGTATRAAVIANDADTFVFPEELLKRELRWRWKASKGLDYAEDMATSERMKMEAIASDIGGTTILSSDRGPLDLRPNKTWPGTITP